MSGDGLQRFIFEGTDVRGNLVRADDAYRQITGIHEYPAPVARLLGEFIAASLLLSATIKYRGRLVLQARSQGLVPLIMAEATHDRKVRAIARLGDTVFPDDHDNLSFGMLLATGTLAVTIEPENRERYQSLVPLTGASLAACLEGYFLQSEQLSTRLVLAASDDQVAGLLLQQLPRQVVKDESDREAQWQHLSVLGTSVTPGELLALEPAPLLRRLYLEDRILMHDDEPVAFECSCSAQRFAGSLLALGADELESLFEAQSSLEVECEFCLTGYTFTRESLADLVRGHRPAH